jgi:hypothetical protein
VTDVATLFAFLRKLYAEEQEKSVVLFKPQMTIRQAKLEYQKRINEQARIIHDMAMRRMISEVPNQGDSTMSTLGDQLRQIAAQIDAGGDGSGGTMVVPGPNGLAIVDGVVLAIDEPIRADWKVSMEARVMLSQGRIGREPSNAYDSGLPKRSPAGYPMVYGIGAFGPQAPGRVSYDGQTFANDGEVESYKVEIAKRPPPGSGRDFSPHPG